MCCLSCYSFPQLLHGMGMALCRSGPCRLTVVVPAAKEGIATCAKVYTLGCKIALIRQQGCRK